MGRGVRGAGDEEPEKFMTDRSFIQPASSSNRTVYRRNDADRYIHTYIHAINLQHTHKSTRCLLHRTGVALGMVP